MMTFGAASAKVNFTMPSTWFAGSKTHLVGCWIRPTTLTSGSRIFGAGAISGLLVNTTTSGLRVVLDSVTTDGAWTSPTGLLTVNTTIFVAFLTSQNAAGATAAVKLWTGTETSGPVEQTMTTFAAPVGAWTAGGTTVSLGCNSTSLSFVGDAGGYMLMADDISVETSGGTITGQTTPGVITQAEANRVRDAFVEPMWRGDLAAIAGAGRIVANRPSGTVPYGFALAASLDDTLAYGVRADGVPVAGTITSATVSTLKVPHPFINRIENAQPSAFMGRGYAKVT